MEQSHGLCESLVSQRDEALRESERLRCSFRDAERTLGTRERAHRHRVKGLEEQVRTARLLLLSPSPPQPPNVIKLNVP